APSPKVANRPATPAKAALPAPRPAPAGGAQKAADARDIRPPALPPSLRIFSPTERAKERKRAEEGMKAPLSAKDETAAAPPAPLSTTSSSAAPTSPGTAIAPSPPSTANAASAPLAASPAAARGTPP